MSEPESVLYRVFLRDLMVKALLGKTLAAARVYSPKTRPTWDGEMPVLILRSPYELKDSISPNGAPSFHTVATVTIAGQVAAKDEDQAERDLETLALQISRAIINDFELTRHIEEFKRIETQQDINTEGKEPLGQLVMKFDLKYYEGAENFAPIEADELKDVRITGDLLSPADQDGIYADSDFPKSATPAPRAEGPDGRAEFTLDVDLSKKKE